MQPEEAGLPYAPLCSAALANLGTNLTALPLRKRSGWSECRSQTCFGFLVIFSVLGFFFGTENAVALVCLVLTKWTPRQLSHWRPRCDSSRSEASHAKELDEIRCWSLAQRSDWTFLSDCPIIGTWLFRFSILKVWDLYVFAYKLSTIYVCVCVDVMGCSYYVVLCCTGIWLVMILLSPRLQPWLNLLLEKGLDRQLSAAGLARLLAAAGRLGVLEAGVP